MDRISIIIPCYNEEKTIHSLASEIKKTFTRSKIKLELLFINDGSKDNTDYEIKKLINENKTFDIVYINLSRNFGKEAAMYAGLEQSTGNYITIIDGDLQQHPKEIKRMYNIMKKDNTLDCVATFQKKRKESFIKRILSKGFYKIANKLVNIDFADNSSDFRLFNINVKNSLLSFKEHNRFTKGIFSWIGFNVKYIEYEPLERKYGKSKWRLKSLIKYAFDGILSYSDKILMLPIKIGFVAFFSTIILFIISLIININLLYSLLLFIVSIIFIFLGIISVYIYRIYTEILNRPIYIAREIIKKEKVGNKHEKNTK